MVGLFGIFTNKEKFNVDAVKENFMAARNKLESMALLSYNDFGQKQESIVETLIKLRDALFLGISLSPNEKIEIVRLVNQAKVKSATLGTEEGYRTFQILDSISEDIMKYL